MTTVEADDWLRTLAKDGAEIDRASTAERVAGVLRSRVLDGYIKPGRQLSEKALGEALKVSRNTLREAFRLLTHERLLVHEYSRGVFVRVPGVADITDLYAARRIIECGALRRWPEAGEARREAIRESVRWGERRAEEGDWDGVGTANIRFHRAITALAGSARLDEEVERLLAELRLAFHVMGDPEEFYRDYLPMNREIADFLDRDETDRAEGALLRYFDVAEQHLVTVLREQ
ncbi:GntR family transcriptional regulator [Saccharothrix coeruleofusca]|uniref:GntR family transcriptional regulator n=1 Tax=Saccharothrix coeruleofusca TaxID=33919 RepID=A0A918AHR6_9PSEU|nr:GntR family transcriptional regulator [Saccharothrix coeruleofusca]MBP2339850.1 DNA-binding GntR family transcriptional regulator [Saccharothrix coeruleofusca]GGP39193.1 GntR family transcriptional regulator [Saccharothrix coeruleofusca]